MFKWASTADEICYIMQKNELKIACAEESEHDIKYLRALQELNKAAELYEVSGEYKKAGEVTRLIEIISSSKDDVDEDEVFKFFGFQKKDRKQSGEKKREKKREEKREEKREQKRERKREPKKECKLAK